MLNFFRQTFGDENSYCLLESVSPLASIAYLKTLFLKSKSPGSSKRDFSDHNTLLQAIFKMCQKMGLSFRKKISKKIRKIFLISKSKFGGEPHSMSK